MPVGGGAAPGLSNPPSRTSTLSNFAQAIGGGNGSSSQTPLDLSCVSPSIHTPFLSDMSSKQKREKKRWRSLNLEVSRDGALDFENIDFGDTPRGAGSEDATEEEDTISQHRSISDSRLGFIDKNRADDSSSREFPSLSGGGPQSQNSNTMSQAWNSTALRQAPSTQQTPVQRPGAPPVTQQRDTSAQQASNQSDNSFHFGSGMEGQYDGQRSSAARPENNTSQSGPADEFPPLGGVLNGETRHDRQGGGMLQGSGFGAGLGSNTFGQSRNSQLNGQGDRATDLSPNDGGFGGGSLDRECPAQSIWPCV